MEKCTFKSSIVTVIFLALFVNLAQCYSQIRRSGATLAVEELNDVVTKRTIVTTVVNPMLKPSKNHEEIRNETVDYSPKNSDNFNKKLDEIEVALNAVDGVKNENTEKLERELMKYVDESLSRDSYVFFDGVKIEPAASLVNNRSVNGTPRGARNLKGDTDEKDESFDGKVLKKFDKYAKNHVLSVNIPQTARYFGFKLPQGKSSFLTGFGLGFLAFGLKKLLLPIFLGAQLVKSVLIAMFLPSILGSIGKIIGKGLSQFSGSSINLAPPVQMEDVDYKDNMGYPSEQEATYTYPNSDTLGTINANSLYAGNTAASEDLANVAMSRFGPGGARVTYLPTLNDNYYRNGHKNQENYKVFKNIPSSSLLLSNYDPFYSPLLSRLDSVFERLGFGPGTEICRERLICLMYASPAKYAPYSNLVSAQLSRELNELRKPTSDNPEILRFFKYMKAAKEGQEGIDCTRAYPRCPSVTADGATAAMLTTYNDINKLVSARKLY